MTIAKCMCDKTPAAKLALMLKDDTNKGIISWKPLEENPEMMKVAKMYIEDIAGCGQIDEDMSFFHVCNSGGYFALVQYRSYHGMTLPALYLVNIPSLSSDDIQCANTAYIAQTELVQLQLAIRIKRPYKPVLASHPKHKTLFGKVISSIF